jgi:hypothetical protein
MYTNKRANGLLKHFDKNKGMPLTFSENCYWNKSYLVPDTCNWNKSSQVPLNLQFGIRARHLLKHVNQNKGYWLQNHLFGIRASSLLEHLLEYGLVKITGAHILTILSFLE